MVDHRPRRLLLFMLVMLSVIGWIFIVHDGNSPTDSDIGPETVFAPVATSDSLSGTQEVPFPELALDNANAPDSTPAGADPGSDQPSTENTDTEPPRQRFIRALPSISGFEIFATGIGSSSAVTLASEPDDPSWSRITEAKLTSELAQLVTVPMVLLEIDCRSTTCGILIVPAPDTAFDVRRDVVDRLSDALSLRVTMLSTHLRAGEPAFDTIYLQRTDAGGSE